MYPSTSSRWCPTPEQLMILDEMYGGGIRTPKSMQIQAITAHLSHYGKIEGKNVFYWFQNRKARERQKLRRKLMMSKQNINQQHNIRHDDPFVHPQLFYYFPVEILPQEVGSINSSPQMMTNDQRFDKQEPGTKTNDCDNWVVMLEGTSPARPLKTLQLFPDAPFCGLKTECSTSSETASSTFFHQP